MDDKDHDHQDDPAAEGTHTTAEPFLVKEKTHGEGPNDLRYPIDDIVERSGTDIEKSAIVIVELYTHVISFKIEVQDRTRTYARYRTSLMRRTWGRGG